MGKPPQSMNTTAVVDKTRNESINRSQNHVVMENSRMENQTGFNISYDNSFTAIKTEILKETVERPSKKKTEFEPIEEKPPTSASSKVKNKQSKDKTALKEYVRKSGVGTIAPKGKISTRPATGQTKKITMNKPQISVEYNSARGPSSSKMGNLSSHNNSVSSSNTPLNNTMPSTSLG